MTGAEQLLVRSEIEIAHVLNAMRERLFVTELGA